MTFSEYDLEVTTSQQSWSLHIPAKDLTVGWNEISTFDVDSPGEIKVTVSNESDGTCVYVDAIKWTFLDGEASDEQDSN